MSKEEKNGFIETLKKLFDFFLSSKKEGEDDNTVLARFGVEGTDNSNKEALTEQDYRMICDEIDAHNAYMAQWRKAKAEDKSLSPEDFGVTAMQGVYGEIKESLDVNERKDVFGNEESTLTEDEKKNINRGLSDGMDEVIINASARMSDDIAGAYDVDENGNPVAAPMEREEIESLRKEAEKED